MGDMFYTNEKNVLILISLLKSHNIKKLILSPGTTNYTFVGSVQNDPYFEIYSCIDERSAAYMACGMASEAGEPVALSCTGSTASRNYYPGLTEAYYRNLPVLAITSHQGTDRIGQLIPQNIDRRVQPNDLVRLSVELPVIKDGRDEAFVVREANRALLELRRGGGGPVHINLFTTYSSDFSVKELPQVRVMHRYQAWENLPSIPSGKVAVYVGSHSTFSPEQTESIDKFCATYDAVVICDNLSGYYGRYRLLPTLLKMQTMANTPMPTLDLMVYIGGVSAATFAGQFSAKQMWFVNERGDLSDPFRNLTAVFQMPEDVFFRHYAQDGMNKHAFSDECNALFRQIYDELPELPFSNFWAAMQLSSQLPQGALFHISASNTRRCWNNFVLPEGVETSSNIGCCGIDGCTSSLIGASLVRPEKLCYLVTGDLAFFYDLNVLGNRNVSSNVRIMVINNGIGAEFQLYSHYCHVFGNESKPYMAAGGHNGNQSHGLLKHFSTDLGYRYISASNKEEFLESMKIFADPSQSEKPMLFEVFTTPENENEALRLMSTIRVDASRAATQKVSSAIKAVVGEGGLNKIKHILGR